ncbi:hypothetical protein EV356DRAFT_528709 [Viridothelium virens]|uniref:Uncharacterized protein n=1 Tax=Viridothelium virens TaxID=1048519 RepID=A0A6A6HLT1_VIRVR|nr:hypothetical protein EV356DRAFT_528709 [Viridothelium virens]
MTTPRGQKRTIQVVEALDFSTPGDPATKRCKLSTSESSATPSPQRSEASALIPTDDEGNLAASESHTSDDNEFDSSGLSTLASSDEECDSDEGDSDDDSDAATTSSSSGSHDRDMERDEVDGAGITNLRIGKKPRIKAMQGRRHMLNLRERLDKFLPRMALANEEIEEQRRHGLLDGQSMENVDEDGDERYIEMDLSLGVLEHKDQGMSDSSSSSSSSDSEDELKQPAKKNIMAKLMGHPREQEKVGIEEMDVQ